MPDTHPGPVPPGRVIAIDPGDRWIGVALSDDHHRLALPNTTIDRRALPQNTAAAIAQRLREALGQDHAALLVVGVPYRRDGSEDAQAAGFHRLGQEVAAALGLPLAVQEERHSNTSALPLPTTTPAGARSGRGGRKPGALTPARRNRQRQQRHAGAAATILQRWLDAQLASPPTRPPTDHEVDA